MDLLLITLDSGLALGLKNQARDLREASAKFLALAKVNCEPCSLAVTSQCLVIL